jgi:DNA-binding response OmpR family regulator
MMVTILAVDDDSEVRATIRRALKREGHIVIEADSAESALRLAQEQRPHMIILDISLGGMSGFDLCAHLRAMPFVNHAPILFLSVHQSAQHVAEALDCGGDDYLRKPFATRELNARVRALLRRSMDVRAHVPDTLHLDPNQRSVTVNGKTVLLTPTEYDLLDHLCRRPSEHHTVASLLETVWQYPPGAGDAALVRNHIRNLRRKIEPDPDHPRVIQAQHGRGYGINSRVAVTESRD